MKEIENKTKGQLVKEIEQLKLKINKIQKDEEINKVIVNNTSDIITIASFSLNAKYLFVSPSMKQVLGYEQEELIGTPILQLIHPADQRIMVRLLKKYLSLIVKKIIKIGDPNVHENLEFRIKNKVGEWRYMQSTVNFVGKSFLTVSRDITKQKELEQNLRNGEYYLRTLFNSMKDIVIVIDNNGKYLSLAPTSPELMFRPSEHLVGKTLHEIFSKAEADVFLAFIRKCLDKDETISFEYPLTTGKKVRWFEGTASPKTKDTVLYIAKDITERKLAELDSEVARMRLEESERKFRELYERSGDAILIIQNGRFVDCNQTTINLLNYNSKDDILNLHPSKLSPEFQNDGRNSVEKADELMREALEKGSIRFEWEHLKSDGSIIPLEVLLTSISNEPGNKVMHVVWRDITNRRKALNDLIENEIKFRTITNQSSEGVTLADMNGNYVFVNPAFCQMSGYSMEELLNLNISDMIYDINAIPNINEVLKKKQGISTVVELKRKDNTTYTTEIEAKQISINNNMMILGTIRDITPWLEAENNLKIFNDNLSAQNEEFETMNEELRDNMREIQDINEKLRLSKKKAEESDQLKSAFLANMSHEIRTPMNGILGFASLLTIPDLSSKEIGEYARIIEESGGRLLNIINDLIDISKIEAGQVEVKYGRCNINSQIDYLYTFFKPESNTKGLKLLMMKTLSEDNACIETDCNKLNAILINLIKNSIKYTHEGSVEFGYKVKGDFIEFFVKDTGIGIPEDRLGAIFERFVQADIKDEKVYEGAGLGLSITQAYVGLLGGKIWVESKVNIGSRFYFTIPFKQSEEELQVNADNNLIKKELYNKKLKILIAEDDEFADNYLTVVLEEFSREILHSKTGRETIDLCRNNEDIDLIMMDIKMPDIDGYNATKQIREFNKNVIIIAQTAYAMAKDEEKALAAGCNDYISKPIIKEELVKKIAKFF